MNYRRPDRWPTDRASALQLQSIASQAVEINSNVAEPRSIVAVDTDYGFAGQILYAAAVVLSFPEMEEIERSFARMDVKFPYYPGLLFYREGPVILEALSKLATDPEVIMINGHGIDHPDRCGMASHIGMLFDKPSIGCARKILAATHRPLDKTRGSIQPMILNGKEVGLALRSKESVKPIFVSPGHKCDLRFAHDIVTRSLRGFRLPEPMRVAHLLANRYRQRSEKQRAGTTDLVTSEQLA
ncbi:MAG: endonuclease V [bacterium]|nr:endonuclease V [bacterium]